MKSFNYKVIYIALILFVISLVIIFIGLSLLNFNFQTISDKSGTWYFPIN
ncbi:hypothetical protein GSH19_04640 [Lactobacillus sp. S2-2]|nr:hypothetical protein [Lactobacillus sp. S2-2]MCF6515439.1 hypothetical protein [Lactobacillus sp. S2-2]